MLSLVEFSGPFPQFEAPCMTRKNESHESETNESESDPSTQSSSSSGGSDSSTESAIAVSSEESQSYYLGVSSPPPILIYRSDSVTNPWVTLKPGDWPTLKTMEGVFDHKLADVWKSDVAPHVVHILSSQGVAWSSIDVCRFITKDKDHIRSKDIKGPVVLWVGVEPTRGNMTNRVQQICQSSGHISTLLRAFNILDVHVEFRESIVARQNGAPLLPVSTLPSTLTADLRIPLTPSIGLAVAAYNRTSQSSSEGTTALFIAEGGQSKAILGLTCRHVLMEGHASHNQPYSFDDTERHDVYFLGPMAYNRLLDRIESKVNSSTIAVRTYKASVDILQTTLDQNPGVEAIEKELSKAQLGLDEATAAVNEFRKFLTDVKQTWGAFEERVIGHLRFAPKIAHNVGEHGYTKDWCVYEINQDKVQGAFRGNAIDLGTEIDSVAFAVRMDAEGDHGFSYPPDRMLRLQGIIPKEILTKSVKPGNQSDSHPPPRCVIKRGAVTGLTIGRATGILSVIYDHETKLASYEWAILNSGDSFSAPGDSGAIIVDGRGQIGGMLTAGSLSQGATIISYATPMHWLWEQVQKSFPDAHLSPVASN